MPPEAAGCRWSWGHRQEYGGGGGGAGLGAGGEQPQVVRLAGAGVADQHDPAGGGLEAAVPQRLSYGDLYRGVLAADVDDRIGPGSRCRDLRAGTQPVPPLTFGRPRLPVGGGSGPYSTALDGSLVVQVVPSIPRDWPWKLTFRTSRSRFGPPLQLCSAGSGRAVGLLLAVWWSKISPASADTFSISAMIILTPGSRHTRRAARSAQARGQCHPPGYDGQVRHYRRTRWGRPASV